MSCCRPFPFPVTASFRYEDEFHDNPESPGSYSCCFLAFRCACRHADDRAGDHGLADES